MPASDTGDRGVADHGAAFRQRPTRTMGSIVAAGDAPQVRSVLRVLQSHGARILVTRTRRETSQAVARQHVGLLLVGLGSSASEGIEAIRTVRATSNVPILTLGERAGSAIAALDAGSDDYVVQPVIADELLARIRSVTRRESFDSGVRPTTRIGPMTVDLASRELVRTEHETEERIRLTRTEWEVLVRLLRTPDRLVTGKTLLDAVWSDHPDDAGSLRFYVSQLRKKLELDPGHPRYIITERGLGYRLTP